VPTWREVRPPRVGDSKGQRRSTKLILYMEIFQFCAQKVFLNYWDKQQESQNLITVLFLSSQFLLGATIVIPPRASEKPSNATAAVKD